MNDKKYGWPTTRCYPRTMDEAFPHDVSRTEWWYPPEKNHTWENAILWVAGIMLWVALAYWFAKN